MPQSLGQEREAPLTTYLSRGTAVDGSVTSSFQVYHMYSPAYKRAPSLYFQGKTVCYGIIHILTPDAHDLTNLNPSLPVGAAPLLKVAITSELAIDPFQAIFAIPPDNARTYHLPSASSQALPAPKPNPTHAGHALRLNRRTEKTTPKERPRVDRIRKDDIAWSH